MHHGGPVAQPSQRLKRIELKILRDGVFVAEDVRRDKGQTAKVSPDIAKILIGNGHAQPL